VSEYESYYVLDAEDRILDWGGPAWASAARAGHATRLAVADFSGERIYEHVSGHFTQRFLRAFFAEARAAPGGRKRTYRCDSPSAKRLFEMRAETTNSGALRVEHWLIDTTPMAFDAPTHETRGARRVGHLRCSICNRLRRRGTREWREPDATPHEPGTVAVVHTVCEDCRRGVAARLPIATDVTPLTSAGSRPPAAPPSSS
jgi:hypothetical protein